MTKLNKNKLTLLLTLLLTSAIYAQTNVPAVISSNQVWDAAGSPYIIGQNTIINNGVTVDILPGTTILNSGSFKLIVDGELNADGTSDSVIIIDKLNFEFSNKASSYNFSTNNGSHFTYCFFKGNSSGGNQTINLKDISLLIMNCRFLNHYYTIYAMYSSNATNKVKVVNSIFESDKNAMGSGYVAYMNGSNATFEMDGSQVINQMGLYPPANVKITRSNFYNWQGWSGFRLGHTTNSAIFRCNTFRKFKLNMFELVLSNPASSVDISNNTFDSADNFIQVSLVNGLGNVPNTYIANNNFLYSKLHALRIGGGNSPGLYDTLDFRDNYWNTLDTLVIAARIYDFRDDITAAGMADFSNFLSTPVSDCSEDMVSIKNKKVLRYSLYPNPSSGIVSINAEADAVYSVKIFDMNGRLVHTHSYNGNQVTLDLSALEQACYILELEGSGTIARQMIIINK